MAGIFSTFRGRSHADLSLSRLCSPICSTSPLRVKTKIDRSVSLRSTTQSVMLRGLNTSNVLSAKVPATNALPAEMQPMLVVPNSNRSMRPFVLMRTQLNSQVVLFLPFPKAYFSPQPQVNSRYLLVTTAEWSGPQATFTTASSPYKWKFMLFFSSSRSGFRQLPISQFVIILVMLLSSDSYLLFRRRFLYSWVSMQKFVLGFLAPPGRSMQTRAGLVLLSNEPIPSCPFMFRPNAYSSFFEFSTKEWQAPQATFIIFISFRRFSGVSLLVVSLSPLICPYVLLPTPKHQFRLLMISACYYPTAALSIPWPKLAHDDCTSLPQRLRPHLLSIFDS